MQPSFGGFIGQLSASEREAVLAAGTRRTHPAGTSLMGEGEHSDHAVVLLAGTVKILALHPDGRDVLLDIRGPGDVLGELAALDGAPRSASVVAMEPVTVLTIPAGRMRDLTTRNPRLLDVLSKTVTARLREADRKRVEFSSLDAAGRVASRIVELVERFGVAAGPSEPPGALRVGVPLTQEEIAGWAGCSREAASKALASLRERGLIATLRRGVVVYDLAALRRRAGAVI